MKTCCGVLLLGLFLGGLTGCKSGPPRPKYERGFQSADSVAERGSLEDLKRRQNGNREAAPGRPRTMQFLVVHDAEGRPVYVELKQSSGNPNLDRRARLYVIEQIKFTPGKTDTVVVSVKPKEVPATLPTGRR